MGRFQGTDRRNHCKVLDEQGTRKTRIKEKKEYYREKDECFFL